MKTIAVGTRAISLVTGEDQRDAWVWISRLRVCADGSARAYAPKDSGLSTLDNLDNAVDLVRVAGELFVQKGDANGQPTEAEPHPGYYLSPSALIDSSYPVADARRYADPEVVPYYVLPPELNAAVTRGAPFRMGDVGLAIHDGNGKCCSFVFGDAGPHQKVGEGSAKLCTELGLSGNARNGGIDSNSIAVIAWPNSAKPWSPARPNEEVAQQAAELLAAWGGGTQRVLAMVQR